MIRNESFVNGVCVEAEVIDLDAGTVTIERDGKTVGSRPITAEEAAWFAPTPPEATDSERVAALEAQNAALLAALATATTLAQIRAAAVGLA